MKSSAIDEAKALMGSFYQKTLFVRILEPLIVVGIIFFIAALAAYVLEQHAGAFSESWGCLARVGQGCNPYQMNFALFTLGFLVLVFCASHAACRHRERSRFQYSAILSAELMVVAAVWLLFFTALPFWFSRLIPLAIFLASFFGYRTSFSRKTRGR